MLAFVALVATGFAAMAQSDSATVVRPVMSAFTIEAGTSHLADTYLTPLHYDGWHTAIEYSHTQACGFNPEKWIRRLTVRAVVDRAENPARNASMLNGALVARWAPLYRFALFGNYLNVVAGPEIEAGAGVYYLSRNGNNPAAAKGNITVNASASVWKTVTVGRLPVTFMASTSIPCIGAFFAPEYGQLYYEIWLGDRSGLVRPAWWGNYFAMDNRISADLHLGTTTLRIGYTNTILSSKANDIVTRNITHAVSLGIVSEIISLPARRDTDLRNARIISAIY